MLRASFLRDHPDIRFRSDLGTLGGEDMVFYRTAVAAGLDARELTGRSRGFYRKLKLCRNQLRELASQGMIPGMVKSSW